MFEKAMLNIDYPILIRKKRNTIDLNLIGKSFTKYLERAELVIDNNRTIIRLYYTTRFPLEKLEWNDKDDCSNLFEGLYQIFIKRYPERDNIPCIRINKSLASGSALDVIFSKEPVKKEYTKTRTK